MRSIFIGLWLVCCCAGASIAQQSTTRKAPPKKAPVRSTTTQPSATRPTTSRSGATRSGTAKTGTARTGATRSTPARSAASTQAVPAYDRIFLKNKTVLRGTIIESTPTQIRYQDLKGTMRSVARSQVSRVEVRLAKKPTPTAPVTSAPAQTSTAATAAKPTPAQPSTRSESSAGVTPSEITPAGSPFAKGDKFLEFSLSLSGDRTKITAPNIPGDPVASLVITPVLRFGVFTRDKVSVGGGVSATFYNDPPDASGQRTRGQVTPFAFIRGYLPMNQNIALYGEGQLAVGYAWNNLQVINTDLTVKQTVLTPAIRLAGGTTVRLGGDWWVNAQVNLVGVTYNRRSYGPDTDANANLELLGRNTVSVFSLALVRFL